MARYHGKRGVVYLSATGSGDAVNVAALSQWSLDMATDKADVTSFGDANKTYVVGLKDVSGKFSGFFDDTASAQLFNAAASADGVKAYLYPSSDAPGRYFYGPAWIDASIATPVGGPVTVEGSIMANGSWGYKLS